MTLEQFLIALLDAGSWQYLRKVPDDPPYGSVFFSDISSKRRACLRWLLIDTSYAFTPEYISR